MIFTRFQKHSETSRQAAEAIQPSLGRMQNRVYQYFLDAGEHGATDEEVQLALDMNPSSQRPRRIELYQRGLIKESGQVRKTTSGRNAAVWLAR